MIDELTVLKNKLATIRAEISALDVAQSAYKVAANSFYGIMALPHFKYYDYRMAEAVTTNGQVFIKKSREYLQSMFETIIGETHDYSIYNDTDSSYLCVQKLVDKKLSGKTDSEIVDYIEKLVVNLIQPTLNKKLTQFVHTMGCDKSLLDKKLENIGSDIIFVAKKKYAFNILYSEGVRYDKPKMKVMGIEIVRSSTPSVVKEYLKESLALCLTSTEIELQKKVKEVKINFMNQPYTNISFPRGVNGMSVYSSSSSIYKKGCPIHVRGSLLYNHNVIKHDLESKYPLISDGDKVKFVFLKMPNTIYENVLSYNTRIPPEFNLEKYVDYNMQFQKAFLAPLENILEAIGWDAEEKVTLDFD